MARGHITVRAIAKLTAAETAKHRLLVEAVRRRAALSPPADRILMDAAIELLNDFETHAPAVAADVLGLPQIGGWAVCCLRRLAADSRRGSGAAGPQVPLRSDLGYLAGAVAATAMRVGHPFDLAVPLRDGLLLLPGSGVADVDSADGWGIARVQMNGEGAAVVVEEHLVILPTSSDSGSSRFGNALSPVPRLRAEAGGLVLNVALCWADPFLTEVGESVASLSASDRAMWQLRVSAAWTLLVRHHRAIAEAFAAGVSTLVPLQSRAFFLPRSATSGLTYGAIGLSLPGDEVSLAEVFVHELHHMVLGAVEDLMPLVNADLDKQLCYAPWRDDPRPVSGLIHGCYAYLGITAFWRRQRQAGGASERLRSAVEFARWRQATLDAAKTLDRSPALTETGRRFAAGICDQLARWQADPVPAEAMGLAAEARTEHRARWRLNYLRPDSAQIEAISRAWLSGAPAGPARINIANTIELSAPAIGPERAYLLETLYRNQSQIEPSMGPGCGLVFLNSTGRPISDADAALLSGKNVTAARGYVRRLEAADDLDAWGGLAIAWHRSGPPASARLLADRPEVVAAVHARLRVLSSVLPDAAELVRWLSGANRDE